MGSKKALLISTLFISLSLILVGTYFYLSPSKYPDKLELLSLLNKQDFKKLDAVLMSHQAKYEKDRSNEKMVRFVFSTFGNSDPSLEKLLDNWVAEFPDSYAANLSRGIYLYNVGFEYRGYKYISKTKDEQVDKMQSYLEKSSIDLIKATELTPLPTSAYSYLMDIARTTSSKRASQNLLNKALSVNPTSFYIRATHLHTLQPKWGGSLEAMAEFIADTKKYNEQNEELIPLQGYLDYTKANILSSRNQRKAALEYNNFSLRFGELSSYLTKRGINYYKLKDYEKALRDFTASLKRWPQNETVLAWRGSVYKKMKMYDEAIQDYNLAIKLSPYDSSNLKFRAYVFNKMEQYASANEDFDKSTYYNPYNAGVYYSAGFNSLYKLNEYEKAEEYFKKAISIKPNNAKYWYTYVGAINMQKDCDGLVDGINSFLHVCATVKQKFCQKDKIAWGHSSLKLIETNNLCPS